MNVSLINCSVDKERIMKVFSLAIALFVFASAGTQKERYSFARNPDKMNFAFLGAEDLFEKEGWLELKKYFECGCQGVLPGVLGGSATTAMSSCTKTPLDSGKDSFITQDRNEHFEDG